MQDQSGLVGGLDALAAFDACHEGRPCVPGSGPGQEGERLRAAEADDEDGLVWQGGGGGQCRVGTGEVGGGDWH